MKYNTIVKNEGALPIPYALSKGQEIARVGSLFKDKPLYLDVQYITATLASDFKIVCKEVIVVIQPNIDLTVTYVGDYTNANKSISPTPSDT